MADLFDDWYTHTVTVRTRGETDHFGGETSEPHENVPCWIQAGSKLIRSASGQEETSSTQLHLKLEYKNWFTVGSAVVLDNNPNETAILSVDVTESNTDDELDGIVVYLK